MLLLSLLLLLKILKLLAPDMLGAKSAQGLLGTRHLAVMTYLSVHSKWFVMDSLLEQKWNHVGHLLKVLSDAIPSLALQLGLQEVINEGPGVQQARRTLEGLSQVGHDYCKVHFPDSDIRIFENFGWNWPP